MIPTNGAERRRSLLERMEWFIRDYVRQRGYAPTYREIGREVGVNSTSLISTYLSILEKRGVIRRHKGVARGIVVIDG